MFYRFVFAYPLKRRLLFCPPFFYNPILQQFITINVIINAPKREIDMTIQGNGDKLDNRTYKLNRKFYMEHWRRLSMRRVCTR